MSKNRSFLVRAGIFAILGLAAACNQQDGSSGGGGGGGGNDINGVIVTSVNDSFTVSNGQNSYLDVLANDSASNGGTLELSGIAAAPGNVTIKMATPNFGSLQIQDKAGSSIPNTILFSPSGQTGTFSFTYTAKDTVSGNTSTGHVTVTVSGATSTPVPY